ncbi:hypothetical protein D3C80_1731020 [compost metagenome]
MELADAVSINALVTLFSSYNDIHLLDTPFLRFSNTFAIFSVPVLMPSLTRKIIFFACLPLISGIVTAAMVSNGDNNEDPRIASDPPLKKSLLLI